MSDQPGSNALLGETSEAEVASALAGNGLWLDVGLAQMRLRSPVRSLASQVRSVYRHFPLRASADWSDLHIDIEPRQRWWRPGAPQIRLWSDGQLPFDPFPADTALPLFEWGANWLIGRRFNNRLLLHAGVLEREGFALVLPALPGSGKSTLTAALCLRGWRLLSDEFGALDLESLKFSAVLKPVGLKNESIDVIRRFAGESVEIGPSFPNTRKGTVAHLAPPLQAVQRVHEPARAGAFVLPLWKAGSPARLERVQPQMSFSALSFNAFNYGVTAARGFEAVVTLARQCPTWQLTYGELEEALALLDEQWPAVVAQGRAQNDYRRPEPVTA